MAKKEKKPSVGKRVKRAAQRIAANVKRSLKSVTG